MAAPAAVEEGALIDDVGSGLHGGTRFSVRLLQVGDRAIGKGKLDGLHAPRLESGQIPALVFQAAAAEHVQHRVVALGPGDFAPRGSKLLLRQVLALEKARQIGRANDQPAFKKLHPALYSRVNLPGICDSCLSKRLNTGKGRRLRFSDCEPPATKRGRRDAPTFS